MFVIEELCLNKFKPVPVPSPRRLKQLFGLSDPLYTSKQTAENLEVVIPYGAKKTQVLALGQKMAEKAAEFVENPNAEPLERINPRENK